jgi:phosphoglycerate dehydrogenase-like enzyme
MLITAPLDAHGLERLQGLSPALSVKQWQHRSMGRVPDDLWQEVEILYTSFSAPLPAPELVPHLRWVQLYSAGPDYILDHPLFATPTLFTTTNGIHAIPIAEYVFAMVLAWFHRLPRIFEQQQHAAWPAGSERNSLFAGEELRGKTLGIVGYGSIGREVARLATAFGMHVLAMQRGTNRQDTSFLLPGIGDPAGVLPERFYSPDEFHAMLGACDVVVISVPLTARTRDMFDDVAFQAIKPTALLVNIARGAICNEAALLHALREKQIAGAILDVFHQEPLPPEHPLWHLSNVFISPHCSGLSSLYEERAAQICEENLRRYLAGEPLYNVVDKAQEY